MLVTSAGVTLTDFVLCRAAVSDAGKTLKRHEHVTFLYTGVEWPPKDKGV